MNRPIAPVSFGRLIAYLPVTVFILVVGVPAIAAQEGTVTTTIPVGPYHITETAQGQQLSMEGFGHLRVPGKPMLPVKVVALAIPPGAEAVGVDYECGAQVTLPGVYTIAANPTPRVIDATAPAIQEGWEQTYRANYAATYGSDALYPARAVELVRAAQYRKYNLVDVQVTPFAYQPLSGRLTFFREIQVHVRYVLPERAPAAMDDNLPATEKVARSIIVNYDQAAAWYPASTPTGRDLYDFVIITLDPLVSAVAPLVTWETEKGRTVNVVTTTWINANYTGYDLAAKIRVFLREKYPSSEWGIQDVLFIGSRPELPMRRCAQDVGYGQPETDFYYAELSQPDSLSWDKDGDHNYGEDTDPIDFYAEVNVGRIPWSDAPTVQAICQKSAAYEQNEDPTFKKNMLLLGAYFWGDTDNAVLMETKVDRPWMTDWTLTRMYEQNADYWSTYDCDYPLLHSNVMAYWPAGKYAFVNWAGHGSPTSAHILGLGAPAFIQSSDCPSLNDNYPAIVFADACSNSDTDELNIGKSMLKQGAIGFLGATKVAFGCPGWSVPTSGSSQSLDYYFTTGLTSGEYTQGQSQQAALRQMYTLGLWDYLRYETFEWGALWGNPDLRMVPPPIMTISFPDGLPDHLTPGVPATLRVQIADGSETYDPASGLLHFRYWNGDFLTSPLELEGSNVYLATLPGTPCGKTLSYYISAATTVGSVVLSPSNAPGTTYQAAAVPIVTVLEKNMDTNPGWTKSPNSPSNQWAWGTPTGGGGEYGGPDPSSGYTGTKVVGYNLSGDYANSLAEMSISTPPFSCTGLTDVKLAFYRWLGVEQPAYDHAYIRVSLNGLAWNTVWQNGATIYDGAWVHQECDLSAYADNKPAVYVRWTMGTTDTAWRFCGWNIDDVKVLAADWEACPEYSPGDLNCDSTVDFGDINPFILVLSNPAAYVATYPGCDLSLADISGDGNVDFGDIYPFVALLTSR